ncbi:RTA1 like protein-domain-containing protein [Ganoderma leucocontextum]|nr:RTA1 like protein-domain-containing protein [Ganoderma leucocontextum]
MTTDASPTLHSSCHPDRTILEVRRPMYVVNVDWGVRKGKYIAYYLFIVLSPCAFIASEYMLMGRIARYLQSNKHATTYPTTVVFVVSDISTFLIEVCLAPPSCIVSVADHPSSFIFKAAGAGLSISKNQGLSKTGEHVYILGGLTLQLASFFVFVVVVLRFLFRDWRTLSYVLIISSIGIMIRCVYRVTELSQGYRGYLATMEGFFYGLDSLPLLIAVAVYTPFWPARMITGLDQLANVDNLGKDGEKSRGSDEIRP